MMSSDFRGNAFFFFFNSSFLKKMELPIKFTLCKQNKHDNILDIVLAFEDYCFCFQVSAILPKKDNCYPKCFEVFFFFF